ncbi:hypothetical protein PMAYCL1PPCAC_23790, partial [Pristionchus mayeri]
EYDETPKNPRPKGWALRTRKKSASYDPVANQLVTDLFEEFFRAGNKLRPEEAERRMRERRDILPSQRMSLDQIKNRIRTLLASKKDEQKKKHRNGSHHCEMVFDVTSSGANGDYVGKMNVPAVFSTLNKPKSQSYRDL